MDVPLTALTSHFATDSWSVELGHHPVEKSKTRALWAAQFFDCCATISDRGNLVSGALQRSLKHPEGNRFIVSDQNSHSYVPTMNASSAADNAAISESNEAIVSLTADILSLCASSSILAAIVVALFMDIFANIPLRV